MVNYDEKSCGLVVFRKAQPENLYLLLHYPSGHWDFAKGHVEAGETEEQTAIRELAEETGITKVNLIPGFRHAISYRYLRQGRQSNKQVVFFLAETAQDAIEISHEHQDHIWLPYSEALAKLTFDNAKQLLIKSHTLLS